MPLRLETQVGPNKILALLCAICQVADKHAIDNYHLLQKYTQALQQLFCNFCRSVGHDECTCRRYELMMDRTPANIVQAKTRPLDQNIGMAQTGFQGRGQGRGGGGLDRGRKQFICYNCRGPRHYAHDCTKRTRLSCKYCMLFDHETEDFPTLIARIRDKGVLPPSLNQNLQMMRSKPRKEDLNVNIVLRSGTAMGDDKGKQPEDSTWVDKAQAKEVGFDLQCTWETFMEAKKGFAEASTSGRKDKPESEMDPSMLTTFLETCMKLLHDSKAMKGLQELINICTGTVLGEPCVV